MRSDHHQPMREEVALSPTRLRRWNSLESDWAKRTPNLNAGIGCMRVVVGVIIPSTIHPREVIRFAYPALAANRGTLPLRL